MIVDSLRDSTARNPYPQDVDNSVKSFSCRIDGSMSAYVYDSHAKGKKNL